MEMFMTDEGETVTLAEYYGQANDPDCGMTSEDLAEIAALEVGETTALGFTVITRITDESDATAVREEPPLDTLQEMAWEDNNARSLGLL